MVSVLKSYWYCRFCGESLTNWAGCGSKSSLWRKAFSNLETEAEACPGGHAAVPGSDSTGLPGSSASPPNEFCGLCCSVDSWVYHESSLSPNSKGEDVVCEANMRSSGIVMAVASVNAPEESLENDD